MTIAVYWETWSVNDLSQVSGSVDIINLAFCDPATTYTSGQMTWANTGLNFTPSFATVKNSILALQKRGAKVMLSCGGATYPYDGKFNPKGVYALMKDLGCDGIDIDWEPADGVASANKWGPIISAFRSLDGVMQLSAAVWSVGAYGPIAGQTYYGVNIPGLESNGNMFNWLNIMAYDAGTSFDPVGAMQCYRIYFKGLLLVGIELGVQGWGPALTQTSDITRIVTNCVKDGNAGVFIWAYNKDTSGSPSVAATIVQCVTGLKGVATPTPAPSTSPFSMTCPNCQKNLTGNISFH